MNCLYTFEINIFNKTKFEEYIKTLNLKIKFISYSFDGQLKCIFDKTITEKQEFELLEFLNIL